jgi:hypothetical protein
MWENLFFIWISQSRYNDIGLFQGIFSIVDRVIAIMDHTVPEQPVEGK